MAANLVYNCDVCGTQKGAANHWHALTVTKESMTLWKWYNAHQSGALHLCSERCVMLAISSRLGRASFAADAPPVVDAVPSALLEDEPVVTEVGAAKCVHCNGVNVVGICTACKEPTCRSCQNWRCERLDNMASVRRA